MNCTERCPDCPSRGLVIGQKYVVSGDWHGEDMEYHILFIGEAPGKEENNRHRVFVGRTGEEFNSTYLSCAGLRRDGVSMTNTVKCHWADSSDAPPDYLIRSCSEFHLRRELQLHNPDLVVLMGGTANSLMGWDVDMEHGRIREGTLLGWTGPIYSTFHPALGMHMSNKMRDLLEDYRRLKLILAGKYVQPTDNVHTDFARLTTAREVRSVMKRRNAWDIAIDTESKKSWRGYKNTVKYTPYCLSFCNQLGTGFLVKLEDMEAISEFLYLLSLYRRLIFHNAPYDYRILTLMAGTVGLTSLTFPLNDKRLQDTMSMAYHDARLPKGLKPLAYRLRGKRMTSFEDTVVPFSRQVAIEYYRKAASISWPLPIQQDTGELVQRKCPDCGGKGFLSLGRGKLRKKYNCECKGTGKVTVSKMTRRLSINQKLDRLLLDLSKNPDTEIWERWDTWAENLEIQPLVDEIGPVPLPSIEYVPEEQQIEYACGDAHETFAAFPILLQRATELRRSVQ